MRQQITAPQIFRRPISLALVLLFAAMIASGCAPLVGDACETNEDCPDGTICDRSVENGMCTVEDCRIGECPSESVCVSFDDHTSYCMRNCNGDDDCRDDHRCIDDDQRDQNYCFVTD